MSLRHATLLEFMDEASFLPFVATPVYSPQLERQLPREGVRVTIQVDVLPDEASGCSLKNAGFSEEALVNLCSKPREASDGHLPLSKRAHTRYHRLQ